MHRAKADQHLHLHHADSDSDADIHGITDSHRNMGPTDTNGDTHADTHPHSDTHTHSDRDADTDLHLDQPAVGMDASPDRHARRSGAHGHSPAHARRYPHLDTPLLRVHVYLHTDSDGHAYLLSGVL